MTHPCEQKWKDDHKEQIRECGRQWRLNHPNYQRTLQSNKQKREWKLRNPKKIKVHTYARHHSSLASNCEFCGSTENLQYHHPDYDYPEIFVTCCIKCHGYIHGG